MNTSGCATAHRYPGAHSTTTSPEEHPTYTPVAADRGKVIQCEVTAINAGGATSAISTGSAPAVTPASPVAVSGPSISAPPVTVTDQLPAGLELVLAALFEGPVAGSGWTCASANSTSFACTRSDALAAGAEYPSITALVYVAPDAPDALVNTAMVEGGGAGAASASDPTAIATVPFGIQSFTTSVTESLGNPFTQAGGRPFSATTGFVFNYVPSVEVSKGSGVPTDALTTAGGSPKDIEVELPPGFLYNLLEAPRCPVAAFEAEACPLDAALGFINVSYLQGRIEAGKPQPFAGTADAEIFNLPAPVGAPALFGFVVPAANLHVALDSLVVQRRRLRHHDQQPLYRDAHPAGSPSRHLLRQWGHQQRLIPRSEICLQHISAAELDRSLPDQPDPVLRFRPADHPARQHLRRPRRIRVDDLLCGRPLRPDRRTR